MEVTAHEKDRFPESMNSNHHDFSSKRLSKFQEYLEQDVMVLMIAPIELDSRL